MDKLREAVYLAALLHDIGKLYQRIENNSTPLSTVLSANIKSLEAVYCPVYKGKPGYRHVLYTAQFLEDFELVFNELFKEHYQDFFDAAVSCHKPDAAAFLTLVVGKAHELASGSDQTNQNNELEPDAEQNQEAFKNERLGSIFEGLLQPCIPSSYRLPVKAFSLKEDFFPARIESFNTTAGQDYTFLWTQFIKELKFLQPADFRSFTDTLLALLEKYMVNIPAGTIDLPDVSLFDHLKSTAAIALCLYDYAIETGKDNGFAIQEAEKPLLLIGADIAGIQAFIYDIAGTEAAKNLKGRSFYLQLLAESVLQKILSELDLYKANVIYASGGGFYLLAPNTAFVKNKLFTLKTLITDLLFEEHQTSLSLAMGYVEISQKQVFNQEINLAWKQLTQKLNLGKRQKFKDRIINNFSFFFDPSEAGGDRERDVITNEEFSPEEIAGARISGKKQKICYLDEEKKKPVKQATYQQVQLGKALKSADYMVLSQAGFSPFDDPEVFAPCGLGSNYSFLSSNKLLATRAQIKSTAGMYQIFAINNPNFLESAVTGTNHSFGYYLYGGNDFPTHENGSPKTFDQLAGNADTSFKRLGILRMDVDNLGQVFINGFGGEKRTFSRYSALSRNLDYFFKGYLNTIWESTAAFKENTYILYAGGDDLFIVGKWDVLAAFAKEIYIAFQKWTCYNPEMGLSGGMAIVGGKFPIAKGAMLSAEEEKRAKSHVYDGREKNAFSLLGHAMNWDAEYPLVADLKNRLVELLARRDELPKALLGKIGAFAEQAKTQKEKQQNESWRWLMAYDFARAMERLKSPEGRLFLNELKISVFTDTYKGVKLKSRYSFLELLNLAARWAELEVRS